MKSGSFTPSLSLVVAKGGSEEGGRQRRSVRGKIPDSSPTIEKSKTRPMLLSNKIIVPGIISN
jgi:hypothetical protein